MKDAENKDYSRDLVLRVSPSRNAFVVEEHKPGGIISYREIDPLELYYAISGSYTSNDFLESGFLPDHCLHVSMSTTERNYIIWNPELRADIIYRDTEYQDFPIPRLVFGLRILENGKVAECSMGVVADVHPDGKVCTGNNVLPRYKKLSAMKNFPRYLLGLPDNDDMFSRDKNKKQFNHQELLEHLKDKDPAYYYTDILVPNGRTLGEFIYRR